MVFPSSKMLMNTVPRLMVRMAMNLNKSYKLIYYILDIFS